MTVLAASLAACGGAMQSPDDVPTGDGARTSEAGMSDGAPAPSDGNGGLDVVDLDVREPVDIQSPPNDQPNPPNDVPSRADSSSDANSSGGDAMACVSTHPLVMGARRYCNNTDCYCPAPGDRGDSCIARSSAAACCPGRQVVCMQNDGMTCALGTHPLVEGMRRFCAAGQCYCAAQDSCRPMANAAACCPGPVVCN